MKVHTRQVAVGLDVIYHGPDGIGRPIGDPFCDYAAKIIRVIEPFNAIRPSLVDLVVFFPHGLGYRREVGFGVGNVEGWNWPVTPAPLVDDDPNYVEIMKGVDEAVASKFGRDEADRRLALYGVALVDDDEADDKADDPLDSSGKLYADTLATAASLLDLANEACAAINEFIERTGLRTSDVFGHLAGMKLADKPEPDDEPPPVAPVATTAEQAVSSTWGLADDEAFRGRPVDDEMFRYGRDDATGADASTITIGTADGPFTTFRVDGYTINHDRGIASFYSHQPNPDVA